MGVPILGIQLQLSLAIRQVTLKNEGPTNTAKPVSFYGLKSKITKGEVARLMLDAVDY